MKYNLFYRNVRAREQLDIFLVSAVASVLLVRFFLYLAGYPQLGGGGLHVAHMLWGGLFMLASITINLAFIGLRVQRLAALLGGIGFGVFIDEIGKFITSDNDYFFRPTVGLIYAIFIILYLTFNFLGRSQRLNVREYQLNALLQLEEAIVHDMDALEKQRARALLARANRRSPITIQLERLLDSATLVPPGRPWWWRRWLSYLDRGYTHFWRRRSTGRLVRLFFVVETSLFVLGILVNSINNLESLGQLLSGKLTYGLSLLAGQFLSAVVAAMFALAGTFRLASSRLAAFEYFRRATLVNLFLTEFFLFTRIQFAALPGFVFNLALLLLITYAIHQEQRTGRPAAADPAGKPAL